MKFFLILFSFFISTCFAVEDFYAFDNADQQRRFQTLTTQFRCLVCQNQNLAESNAPLAADLRDQIYQRLRHGKSDPEIVHYLTARYGNYILYRPPFNGETFLLWLGPLVLLFSGIGYLFYYLTSVMDKDSLKPSILAKDNAKT